MSVRTVHVTVMGEFLQKDSKNAGVQGEGNVTSLHILLDESWKGFGKRIVWRDARGENPVAIILYNAVEDLLSGKDPLAFETPIPPEALAFPGWCSFVIEGFRADTPAQVSYSVMDRLLVKLNDNHYTPVEPTAGQALQLQAEIEGIVSQVTELVEEALEALEGTEREISLWEQYNPETQYFPLNKVMHRGRSYINKKACKNVDPYTDVANDPKACEGNFWMLIADMGDRGEQGLTGRMGPPGPQGVAGVVVETQGKVAFHVDADGFLWCFYAGEAVPPYFIDEDGNLCYEITE